jgi:uncharacterized membrane protein
MGIDVTSEIELDRPRAEVAAYIEDPGNDLTWIRALTGAEKLTEGPLRQGTRVRRVAKMMGKSMTYTTEVVAYTPGERVEMRTIDGPPMHVTYILGDTPGGTRVTIRNAGGAGLMFKIAAGAIGHMVRRRVDGDLAALKQVIEARPRA